MNPVLKGELCRATFCADCWLLYQYFLLPPLNVVGFQMVFVYQLPVVEMEHAMRLTSAQKEGDPRVGNVLEVTGCVAYVGFANQINYFVANLNKVVGICEITINCIY